MDLQLINRLNMVKNVDKFLNIFQEIKQSGTLGLLLALGNELQAKMELFNIPLAFNFLLWTKLKNAKSYFNYLRMAKDKEIKVKWFNVILENIPDVLLVLDETNPVFDYYKETITSLINTFFN